MRPYNTCTINVLYRLQRVYSTHKTESAEHNTTKLHFATWKPNMDAVLVLVIYTQVYYMNGGALCQKKEEKKSPKEKENNGGKKKARKQEDELKLLIL